MIVYLDNLNIQFSSLNNLNSTNSILKDSFENYYFYSDEGIFSINNNKIFKLFFDSSKKSDKLDKYNVFIQDCYIKDKKEYFYIPINNIYKKHKFINYKLNDKSPLTLKIIISDNEVDNFYFEISDNSITESIKEDILTFLSILKFC